MTVAFVYGPNSPKADLTSIQKLYASNPAVRRAFDEAAAATRISPDLLLGERDIPPGESVMRVNSVSLGAAMLGLTEALAELGVTPSVVGGVSLGAVVSTCAGGAISRRQLFELLAAINHDPASPRAQEATAFVFVPQGERPRPYLDPPWDGVYLGADFGVSESGEGRALMLSGYRSALDELAAEHQGSPVKVRVREQRLCRAAYHTPLREHALREVDDLLRGAGISDPAVPVCSGILDRPATTVAGIRELLLRNHVDTMLIDRMTRQMAAHGTEIVAAIGPSMTGDLFSFPWPVVHVGAGEDLGLRAAA